MGSKKSRREDDAGKTSEKLDHETKHAAQKREIDMARERKQIRYNEPRMKW